MAGEGADQRLRLSLPCAQVEPGWAARRAAPGRLSRDPLGGLAFGDVPLQAVVELLEEEGGEASRVGRQQVVQLAGVVAREGLECPALIRSGHACTTPRRTPTWFGFDAIPFIVPATVPAVLSAG